MTRSALDLDLLAPTASHDPDEIQGIVVAALVEPHPRRRRRMTRTEQINGKPNAVSSCENQVVLGLAMRPIRFVLGTLVLMCLPILSNSKINVLLDTISPLLWTTQMLLKTN